MHFAEVASERALARGRAWLSDVAFITPTNRQDPTVHAPASMAVKRPVSVKICCRWAARRTPDEGSGRLVLHISTFTSAVLECCRGAGAIPRAGKCGEVKCRRSWGLRILSFPRRWYRIVRWISEREGVEAGYRREEVGVLSLGGCDAAGGEVGLGGA